MIRGSWRLKHLFRKSKGWLLSALRTDGASAVDAANREEWLNQSFSHLNERPVEYSFVFRQVAKVAPRTVLDVGTGVTALPRLLRTCGCMVTATDNVRDFWPSGMHNPHYYVYNDDITNTRLSGTFDLITCVSVLEHIKNYEAAVLNMLSLLKPGGHLVLSFPYNERIYCPNVYKLIGSNATGKNIGFITQTYSRHELVSWTAKYGARIVEQEYWQFFTGDFWTVGDLVVPPKRVFKSEKHQISCILMQRDGVATT